MVSSSDAPLLAGIRVLDLATPRAELAGRMLAELGATVLKLEPPAGTQARTLPPFDESDGPGRGASLYWAALGLGKRSAVLDIETAAGQRQLRDLACVADVLIESYAPGYLDALGLGYEALGASNPRLVYASAAAYGASGPKAQWPATDLTLEAAGGRLALQGDRDRPPLPVGYPQASFHTGGRLAADIIIAVNERDLSGLGQHLDASMQEAVLITLMNAAGFPHYTGGDPPGTGDDRATAAVQRGGFLGRCDCADGYVVVTATSQAQLYQSIAKVVVPELRERGLLSRELEAVDWEPWPAAARADSVPAAELDAAIEAVRLFFRLHTKAELMRWAWQADVHLGPVHSTADLVANEHLAAKGYWCKVGNYTMPGLGVRMSRSVLSLGPAAPALGADQALLEAWLREAGADKRERPERDRLSHAAPSAPGPARSSLPATGSSLAPADRPGEAFAGLKVLDMSWVAVGPITAKALADHGATVVRVESATRVDYVRTLTPFKDGIVGINRSHFMNNLNSSKFGVALNLALPEGRILARRLADWSDVIVENFTPGTMARLGLEYATLSRERPDLIMLSTCLLGQTGPWASFAGYGPHGAGIAGFYGVTGWPDRAPCGPSGPYTDVVAPHYTVSALAAAVWQRRRTGLGQHIDVSQVEAAIHFIEPLILDETVNGRTAAPAGLGSLTACPHGVYATAGSERYVAVAVETPAQWRALRALVPLDDFTDPRLDQLSERLVVKDSIDAALRAWTAGRDRREVERALVKAGVPASVVQRPTELVTDPQLLARDFFQVLEHGEIGPTPFDGLMTHFSAKRRVLHKAAPCVGEDTEQVMRVILGLSDDEIADYAAAGIFT
jgi:crotonobetainyl-CoA:carnitine CoA-transferase CaiB-like acyl-CoA transferase